MDPRNEFILSGLHGKNFYPLILLVFNCVSNYFKLKWKKKKKTDFSFWSNSIHIYYKNSKPFSGASEPSCYDCPSAKWKKKKSKSKHHLLIELLEIFPRGWGMRQKCFVTSSGAC